MPSSSKRNRLEANLEDPTVDPNVNPMNRWMNRESGSTRAPNLARTRTLGETWLFSPNFYVSKMFLESISKGSMTGKTIFVTMLFRFLHENGPKPFNQAGSGWIRPL